MQLDFTGSFGVFVFAFAADLSPMTVRQLPTALTIVHCDNTSILSLYNNTNTNTTVENMSAQEN